MSIIYAEEDYSENFLKKLWQKCTNEDQCDVVLIAGNKGKRIPAHRLILSVSSEYFRGMFASSMYESTKKEVELPSVDGDALQGLIEYSYTGRVEINEDVVVEMLKTAEMLLLRNVVTACGNFLVEQLHSSNCLGFALLAEQYRCEKLLYNANDYSLKHFLDVCKTDEFFRLNAEQLSQLLASDDLYVSGEEDVFKSLISWIGYDRIEREKYKEELLRLVRMPLLERSFLVEHVKPICTSAECLQIYIEALEWNLLSDNKKFTPRISTHADEFLLAMTLDKEFQETMLHYYCQQQHKWLKWLKQLDYRKAFGIAVMAENIYMIGGRNTQEIDLNTGICLNLKTMTLSQINPMLEDRSGCRAIVLRGFLYIVGGIGKSSAEKWDPKTNSWSCIASMATERGNFGIIILNEEIYVVGGCSKTHYLKSTEYYNPDKNVWEVIAPMRQSREAPGVAALNGLLYAVGGSNDNTTVERYDPKANNWTMICSLSENLYGIQPCTTFQNKLVVCYADRFEEYDPETNKWKATAPVHQSNSFHRLFTYSDKLLTSEFVEN